MRKLREILMPVAMEDAASGRDVYMLVEVNKDTTVGEIQKAFAFARYENVSEIPERIREAVNESEEIAKAQVEIAVKRDRIETAKRIDHGKIIALHNANWSTKKIAEEIGCSEQTVKNHIEREGKKEE